MGQTESMRMLNNITAVDLRAFKILSLIGKGSFGCVWLVEYMRGNRKVALKQIAKSFIIENKIHKEVFNERDILASLFSNHIVNLYATFQDDFFLYIVMDYCEGKDLRSNLDTETYNEQQIKFMVGCAVLALEFIHSQNVLHRDIKPENLIFDSKGYLRILDFGLSVKLQNEHSKNIDIYQDYCGTPCYMAPERFIKYKGKKTYGFESDLYSLGVVLYEIVMGERPFNNEFLDMNLEEVFYLEEDGDNFCDKDNRYFNVKNTVNLSVKSVSAVNKKLKVSKELCEFINGLLRFNPLTRLGHNGYTELKTH